MTQHRFGQILVCTNCGAYMVVGKNFREDCCDDPAHIRTNSATYMAWRKRQEDERRVEAGK